MSERVATFDWAATPLGPRAQWPVELQTMVSFILESAFPKAIVWGPSLTTIYNDAFKAILGGKPDALGRSFAEIWAEAWDDIGPIAERALAGQSTFIEDFALTVDRTGHPEQAYFTFCYSPIRLADGTVAGMMDTVVETTATVRARNDLEIINFELRHRLKNNLASVQTLVRQTLKNLTERGPAETLSARIVALAEAHDVLFEEGWSEATVGEVARTSLTSLLDSGRIEMKGPQARIGARAAVALSLVLHELATNAAKYGALSCEAGKVELSWRLDRAHAALELSWREVGGPPAAEPLRTGFGSRLIDMGMSPKSRVERTYGPDGFAARITAPLDELAVS